MASEGAGSHGTLHAGDRKTTVKDRKKEIGKGLLGKMLADLGIERNDFQETYRRIYLRRNKDMPDTYNYPAEIERNRSVMG